MKTNTGLGELPAWSGERETPVNTGLQRLRMKRNRRFLVLFVAIAIFSTGFQVTGLQAEDGCMNDGCHIKMQEKLKKYRIQHPPAKDGACETCHNSHGDNTPVDTLLKLPIAGKCFECHVEFGETIRNSSSVHTLVREDRCTECHEPHGGRYTKLRKKYYPPSEWDPYGWSGTTRMCMNCHPPDELLGVGVPSGSGFRNGTRNLHREHVSQGKGRTCAACHAAHASDQEFHLRAEVPFGTGGWKLPLHYTKTPNGGSCIVGCHRELGYDRKNAIYYEPLVEPVGKSKDDGQGE